MIQSCCVLPGLSSVASDLWHTSAPSDDSGAYAEAPTSATQIIPLKEAGCDFLDCAAVYAPRRAQLEQAARSFCLKRSLAGCFWACSGSSAWQKPGTRSCRWFWPGLGSYIPWWTWGFWKRSVKGWRGASGGSCGARLDLLLSDDLDSPGSPLPLLPGLHSSPTGFNLCGWRQKKNRLVSSALMKRRWDSWWQRHFGTFTCFFLFSEFTVRPVSFVLGLESRCCRCGPSFSIFICVFIPKSRTDSHSPSSCLHFSNASSVA